MDSLNNISDKPKIGELRTTESEEYYTRLLKKNCEILKALDLNTWKDVKKKERNECVHCLKKWKCYSGSRVLESFTASFMDEINLIERKLSFLSELEKSNKMIAESEAMYKILEKGIKFSKENICTMKNTFPLKEDITKYPVSDLYISEKRKLTFERLNDLLRKSSEGEKEIEKLKQMKKQLSEK